MVQLIEGKIFMTNNAFSNFSDLSSKEFNGKPVAAVEPVEETKMTPNEVVEVSSKSDSEVFMDYLNSDDSQADLDQYEVDQIPSHKKQNGNFADILPAELNEKKVKNGKNRKAKPTENIEPVVKEDDFAKIMNRTGFHFDEETGTLEF